MILLSPLTTGSAGIFKSFGTRLPSIHTLSGTTDSPSTARFIAAMVACRMFSCRISSGSAKAMLHATACSLIICANISRFFSLSFFESVKPGRSKCSGKITAAANTLPTKGPRPASSTPALKTVAISSPPV
ncbi:Uncharacterised protein [Mycobacteroides abscessus subsp. massiliense]|nr:Uncharacterised protein [Mycobacteroides abscessus subsp. massiliense]